MDSSRGEKREVNPPTVYRPEAVYSATIHNPTVDSRQQRDHRKPTFLGLLTHRSNILAEYFRADGRNVFAKGENPHKQDHFQQVFLSVWHSLAVCKLAFSVI